MSTIPFTPSRTRTNQPLTPSGPVITSGKPNPHIGAIGVPDEELSRPALNLDAPPMFSAVTETQSVPLAACNASEAEALEHAISKLWLEHGGQVANSKRTRKELQATRSKLATELAALKAHLARAGRSGRWAKYLREQRIPLATADRYVKSYNKIEINPNLASEEVSKEPTAEQMQALATKIAKSTYGKYLLRVLEEKVY